MNRAVFLDRDGVINAGVVRNGRPYPPPSLEEFEFLPGVPEAVEALKQAGFLIVVATNQPDVATGVQRREVVEAMHDRVRRELCVDDIQVCYHVNEDKCACRKPKPGMLLSAAEALNIDLSASYMVGDRWRDIDAGKAAGCRTIWINYGYDEQEAKDPDAVVRSLSEARDWIFTSE
jgi:D-glycero-D-manno-heptose 1,7-bisphosphate phosphatase